MLVQDARLICEEEMTCKNDKEMYFDNIMISYDKNEWKVQEKCNFASLRVLINQWYANEMQAVKILQCIRCQDSKVPTVNNEALLRLLNKIMSIPLDMCLYEYLPLVAKCFLMGNIKLLATKL